MTDSSQPVIRSTEKLDAELKAKWLQALRSGDYRQGTGELCCLVVGGGYKHCCLGVLAEVAGLERERIRGKCHLSEIGADRFLGPWSKNGDEEYSTSFPDTHTNNQRKLAGMNDTGKTFPEIADWIEANLWPNAHNKVFSLQKRGPVSGSRAR